MRTIEDLPTSQSMKAGHRVRRFRRGNTSRDRQYLAHKPKPWKTPNTVRSAA